MPKKQSNYRGEVGAPVIPDTWGCDDERRKAQLRDTAFASRLSRPKRLLARLAVGVMMPMGIVAASYWTKDVMPERDRLKETRSEVVELYTASNLANNDTAVVDFAGLGNLSAEKYVRSLSTYAEMGRGWMVRYDNKGIDIDGIAENIDEKARKEGVNDIVVVGHSMGGLVALEVARHIYEETDLRVAGVVLDGTPLDIDSVRPQAREQGMEMLRLVGDIPGARESRLLRGLVEVAARRERFVDSDDGAGTINPRKLVETVEGVYEDKLHSDEAASTRLIEAQFRMILASGATGNLESLLRSRSGKLRPQIMFIRPRIAEDDPVVDVDRTRQLLSEMVPDQLTIITGDGIQHANPVQQPEAYRPLMSQVVRLVERAD